MQTRDIFALKLLHTSYILGVANASSVYGRDPVASSIMPLS